MNESRGTAKRPYYFTDAERQYYERIPKRVLWAIARDYAAQCAGIGESESNPEIVLEEIKQRRAIVEAIDHCQVFIGDQALLDKQVQDRLKGGAIS